MPVSAGHGRSGLPARRLVQFLATRRRRLSPLLILTHDYPDPDALASAYGLHHLAQHCFGIDARIVYGGVISRAENRAMVRLLDIPVHKLKAADLRRYRNIALVDTQPAFENNQFPADRRATLVVDQHRPLVEPAADLAVVDTACGATCVIIAQALLLAAADIPATLATAIAYGIISDTLDLYRAERADIIQTYLKILHLSDMGALARIQNPPRSRRFFTTLGRGIRGAAAYHRVMVSHLGPVWSPEAVAQVADFLLSYEHIDWTLCTGRFKGHLHLSLRTRSPHGQAGEVLRALVDNPNDAGGHGAIAGGRVRAGANADERTWKALEQTLQARLARRLRLPARGEFRRIFDDPPPRV